MELERLQALGQAPEGFEVDERRKPRPSGDMVVLAEQILGNLQPVADVKIGKRAGTEYSGSDQASEKENALTDKPHSPAEPESTPVSSLTERPSDCPASNQNGLSVKTEMGEKASKRQQSSTLSLPSHNTENNTDNCIQLYSAGPDAGKQPSECRKRAIRMPEPDAGPSAGPDAGASPRGRALRSVNKSKTLSVLFDPDSSERTLRNACIWILNYMDGDDRKARAFVNALDLNALFHPDDWYDRFWRMFCNMKRKFVKVKPNEELVLSFVLRKAIKGLIPASEWRMSAKNQKIVIEELIYVCKTITGKILRRWNRERCDSAVLAHAYFHSPGYAAAYKKATRRSVGRSNHKIGRITDLLDQYGLLVKIARRDEANRQRASIYRMGSMNPYDDRLGKKTQEGG